MLLVHLGIASKRQFQCAPTTYDHSINEFFTIKQVFKKTSLLLFMFQCNEYVKMTKFLCSLACTWTTIMRVWMGVGGLVFTIH